MGAAVAFALPWAIRWFITRPHDLNTATTSKLPSDKKRPFVLWAAYLWLGSGDAVRAIFPTLILTGLTILYWYWAPFEELVPRIGTFVIIFAVAVMVLKGWTYRASQVDDIDGDTGGATIHSRGESEEVKLG